jgi:two-component system CheB/CheR fusion protein
VAIGASAGGLDPVIKLMDALPAGSGLALILVQHMDPGHQSMLVELLTPHTAMTVCQAAQGMPIEPDHLYVIAPGTYLSVEGRTLRVSAPPVRHGKRMPFDFLLRSLAQDDSVRAACVVLSGTGTDGSIGALDIKHAGGLVVAQLPEEAAYDGMPRSAIETGAVAAVLPVAAIPAALLAHRPEPPASPASGRAAPAQGDDALDVADQWLPRIVELLRTTTVHDFTRYKAGTLRRRVQRRMALASLKPDEMQRYFDRLRTDASERDLLAKDLLINVTSFFRDPTVFATLSETVIPELVRGHLADRPLRIWVAGCSTGEETYSIAILFLEQISLAKRPIKLQVFASDVDADAVAVARDGIYPDTIRGNVSPERLARFFSHEDGDYRVHPDLRGAIVFAVQDILADPPFSRLDFVSCRNLLIYLKPDAQARVVALFHFALRNGGVLLLGSAETVADAEGRFDVISKADRIYQRIGRNNSARPGQAEVAEPDRGADSLRRRVMPTFARAQSRPTALAELGRRLLIENYAPAAILINATNETLFCVGPTDRYVRLPPGHATQDVLAMARSGLRTKLRAAIEQARHTRTKVVAGGRITGDGQDFAFNLEVLPVPQSGEDMLLVCFVDTPPAELRPGRPARRGDAPQVAELERELESTRAELQETLRDLQLSTEEQNATNEEALSINEEYQSTNEELLTSKEELQSLNEELTALNSQLQEALERQRITSDDLQNVLYSTNVATLFLDLDLKIRFFTPATQRLFSLIASDVGRPLADLAAVAADDGLTADARQVLERLEPVEREIKTKDDVWYRRRILPYRAHGDRVEGVVITLTDVTARRKASEALEAAKKQAETATAAKSRFLAAASHDLRQPLQTLALLQGLLARLVEGDRAKGLLGRLDETLVAMTTMLDTLLDINEIEAGTVRPEMSTFGVQDLLSRIRAEFAFHAEAKGLALHVVDCSLKVTSDPRLLEQMLRNLVSNALKYTTSGRVLVGCRRVGANVSVEVWDTGRGIPEADIERIFEEYWQSDNAARERSRGLGLGLSIVKRLGELLGHTVTVRSMLGEGSHFAISVPIALAADAAPPPPQAAAMVEPVARSAARVLVVEDDPDLRELLHQSLRAEGYHVVSAPDGLAALESLKKSPPALLLADFNLPDGLNGLELAVRVRRATGRELPVIILTGDISAETRGDVAQRGCTQLNKPVKQTDLLDTIKRLLDEAQPPVADLAAAAAADVTAPDGRAKVVVVDDDDRFLSAIVGTLEDEGWAAVGYESGEAFLAAERQGSGDCLLIDAYLPGMSGLDLLERLRADGNRSPAIMITGQSDVPMAVRAMKAGAVDFIEKPISHGDLMSAVSRALEQSRDASKLSAWREDAARHLAALTPRQHEIMSLVLAGLPSKNIALDLGISQRTVENHRASIMRKTGATSLPALARLALAAQPAASHQA